MKKTPTIGLGLSGYGLMRAAMACKKPSHELGVALSEAIGRLPGITLEDTELLHKRLTDPKRSDNRRDGLRGVAKLFAEHPEARQPLIAVVRGDPHLAENINAWNDPLWMRTADDVMGVGESVAAIDPSFFEKVRDGMRRWSISFLESKGQLTDALIEGFSTIVKRTVTEDVVRDDELWNKTLPFLWLYWSTCQFPRPQPHTNLRRQIRNTVITLRMLRRLAASDFDSEVHDIMYEPDGTPKLGTKNKIYAKLWERMHQATPPQHPLEPMARPKMGHLIDERLENWIARAIAQGIMPEDMKKDRAFITLLKKVREEVQGTDLVDEFIAILIKPDSIVTDKFTALKSLREETARALTVDANLNAPILRWRIVTWNPYAVDDDVVIHEDLGEARILEGPLPDGMVKIRLIGQDAELKVMPSKIIEAQNKDAFLQALEKRARRFSFKAPLFAALALKDVLAKQDPTKDHLYGIYGIPNSEDERYVASLDTIRDDLLALKQWHGQSKKSRTIRSIRIAENLLEVGSILGLDPITWSLRLASGINPAKLVEWKHMSKIKKRDLRKRITPDLIRSLVWFRPWNTLWTKEGKVDTPNTLAAGNYYPEYYHGSKPNDFTELYFGLRDGNSSALEKSAEFMNPLVKGWVRNPSRRGPVILAPMIGTAPTRELCEHFRHPIVFPWMPRPEDYGEGVEGKTLYQKMHLLNQALRLDPDRTGPLEGSSVLIVDDNLTDGATWMVARRLLFEAGAAEVGIVTLTETIRRQEDHDWVLR
jgi:hypothetical protein